MRIQGKTSRLSSFYPALFLISGLLSSATSHAYEVEFEKDKSVPIVYINVAIKGGSVTDPRGQGGLTNFMGEMLLRGTQSKTKEQIDLALDQMGARLDVEIRAEAMIFRGAVLSSQLDPYLKLLNEILTQPSFTDVEIKKLKSEMISTLQEELGHDSSLASRRFSQFLFRGHPYGNPVLGNTQDIEQLSKDQIIAHYRRLVQDKLILVIGTGDASEGKISSWSKELAAMRPNVELSAEESKLLEKVSAPKNAKSKRLLIIDKPDRTQTQINVGQIGIRMTDSDYFPLYLGNYAFGGPSFSSTLMVEIRVKRGWSYGANSSFRFGLQPRSWHLHLFPSAKDTASALGESLKLVRELKEKGISQEQFEFAQRSLANSSGFMYNTPRKRVENKLLERTLDLPDGFMKSYGPKVSKLQRDQVNNALKEFLKPDELSMTVLGTAKNLQTALAKAAGIPVEEVEVRPYTQQ